ncbi:MAG: c-type cytochrome [Myxococcota bacterium]
MLAFVASFAFGGCDVLLGSFDAAHNGARIFYTGANSAGETIAYAGGPGPEDGVAHGVLTCALCHGRRARGGSYRVHGVLVRAPDIRWSTLEQRGEGLGAPEGYTLDAFRMAVVDGRHPDGTPLDGDMPRYELGDEDLSDLASFLQSIP